jgi:cytochrome c peroxidase
MSAAFKEVMKTLATIGQDNQNLIDCSEVIPVPKPAVSGALYASTAQ